MTVSAARMWQCWLRPAAACTITGDGSASGYRRMTADCTFRPEAKMTAEIILTVSMDDIYSEYAGLPARIPAHAGTHGTTTTLA